MCVCVCVYLKVKMFVTQSYLTLSDHGLQPASLLHQWDFPGKNTRAGSHSLLQGIFPTQDGTWVSALQILYHLSHQGSPNMYVCFGV